MPNISTFMYCEETSSNEGKFQINGPLQIITPAFVPGMFSFAIVFGLLGIDSSETNNILKVKFINLDLKDEPLIDTGDMKLDGLLPAPSANLPREMTGIMMNLDFRNIIFQNEGVYTTEIYLNDALLGEFPVQVKEGES